MQTENFTIRTSSTCSTFTGRGFNADASYDGLHLHYLLFRVSKPMQKEQDDHRKMINSLIKGDWVITIGGVVAQIVEIQEHVLILKKWSYQQIWKIFGNRICSRKTSIRSKWDWSQKREKKAVRRKIPSRKKL